MKSPPPLLIDRRMLESGDSAIDPLLVRALAELNRVDRPLVLLAERPDRWTPTRTRVDRALEGQNRIEREIHRAGGVLDAVLYLDFGLFSRRRKRQAALDDLADRYGCRPEALIAITRPGRLAEALKQSVGNVLAVDHPSKIPGKIAEIL